MPGTSPGMTTEQVRGLVQDFKQPREHAFAFSQALCAPSFAERCPSKRKRAQGMPDAWCTRSLACEWKMHTSVVTAGTPKRSGIPRAMVLRFPARSPRRPGFFASVIGAMQSIVANLTPAKGRQDHTTSPSVPMSFV